MAFGTHTEHEVVFLVSEGVVMAERELLEAAVKRDGLLVTTGGGYARQSHPLEEWVFHGCFDGDAL